MCAVLATIAYILQLFFWVIIASAVMSWLLAFNVVNGHNPAVRTIWNVLTAMTEPFLNPIRRVVGKILPNMRGIDISPIFLIIILFFLQNLIARDIAPLVSCVL